jgi:hypothetical protein
MEYRRIALWKEGVFGWRSDFECAFVEESEEEEFGYFASTPS